MRNNVIEKCDNLIRINTNIETESLNVSNASAIVLHHFFNKSN